MCKSATSAVEEHTVREVRMSEPDYGEVTLDGLSSRLKVLEHQFGGLIKDILKLKLQNEKRERSLESLLVHVGRIEDRVQYLLAKDGLSGFENWKPKLSPVKDEDGNTD
jgi:hypothetical protein